jgi:hypothetical protein
VEEYAEARASSDLTTGVDSVDLVSVFDRAELGTIAVTASYECIAEGRRGIWKRSQSGRQIPKAAESYPCPIHEQLPIVPSLRLASSLEF